MLYLDYNSTIRDIFRQVEEISQHGLEELYDKDVEEGKRSYSEAIISAGLVSKEDLINLVSQFLSILMKQIETLLSTGLRNWEKKNSLFERQLKMHKYLNSIL